MTTPPDYLGDGVYASHDGYQIWLAANHPESAQRVALEPSVFLALCRYAERAFAMKIIIEQAEDA